MTESITPILYNIEQVSEMTGLSISTLRRAVARGELAPTRFGTTLRFTRDALDAWISSSTAAPSSTLKKKAR